MGHYTDLLDEIPSETPAGWSAGAIGESTIRSLIEGDLWHTYSQAAPGSVGGIETPGGIHGASTKENQGLLIDVAKAIRGDLDTETEREGLIVGDSIWIDSTINLQFILDLFLEGDIGFEGFLSYFSGKSVLKAFDSASIENSTFDDEKIRRNNQDLTAEDILAYNLKNSSIFPILIDTAAEHVDTGYFSPEGISFENAARTADEIAILLELKEESERQALEERFRQSQQGESEAKAALEEDIEQSEQDVKIHMQALLAYHLTTLSEFNQARGAVMPRYEKTYLLDGPPSELVNKLTYVPGSEDFAKITVPEASSLVPMIRLFKISYNSKGELDRERPEIPLIFKTFTDVDSDFMSGHGAGRSGVGIKSFDWQYNGTNPATVKNDITAKLVLYFQNFNDLLKEQENGFKYVDLLVRTNPTSEEDKEKPIEGPNETGVVENKSTTEGDSKYYEIKATVGWAPNPDYARDFSNKPNLAKSIKNQQVSLFLTLVEHEFSVRQDGTFELTIDYRGRIDGIMMDKRADVILDGEVQRQVCKLTKELEEAKSSCFQDEIENIEEKIEDVKVRARFESHTKIFTDLLQTGRIYYAKIDNETWEAAGRKIANLKPGDIGISEEIEGTKVLYEADENLLALELRAAHEDRAKEDALINIGGCEGSYDSFSGKFNARFFAFGKSLTDYVGVTENQGAMQLSQDDDEWWQCFKLQYNQQRGLETPGDKPLAINAVEYPNGQLGEKYGIREDDGSMIIPYFFLGDLIDIAARKAIGQQNETTDEDECNTYYHPNRVENMAIILGSLEIAPHGTQKQWEQINIGDIPICLPYFRDWWARHTTKSSKNTYPLVKFIRDCLKDFALEALGDDLFDGMRAQKLLIKDASISVPANVGGVDPIRERIRKEMSDPKKADLLAGSRLRLESIDNTKPMQLENPTNLTPNDMFFYKVFYLVSDSPDYLRGNKEEDLQRGIQHIVMGSRSGLLKEANFSRSTAAGLREQRVVEESEFNPLSHLADVYNIDARMIGNVMFYPGQYIYLNPIGFGTKLGNPSDPGSPSRAMGLGGYHLITQVSSFIENGKFETTIEALWETSGGPGSRRNEKGQKTEKTECGSKVGTSNTALAGAPEGIPGTTSNIENP
jgi:hypothetical protein